MAEITSINPADLRAIERNLDLIYKGVDVVSGTVDNVDNNVRVVYDEVGKLAQRFEDYMQAAEMRAAEGMAETRLIKIRQELETKYGHYAEVRRTTTGILQADDLGIVKKATITNASEELMISAPNYWLAPCLVALAAWINDQPELADKALREAIKRNDEKTSLLFALICRRADRRDASLKWTQRYLANQDEENLDRKCIIILDAFASGLLGSDSEGVVSRQIGEWLEHLAQKPGFVEQQTKQWSDAINLKRKPLGEKDYPYLRRYSHTWPALADILEGAQLHATIFDYFEQIFNQEVSTESVKVQLDEILMSLVSDFDDEELPLRKEEKLNQFIIDFHGDAKRAQSNMQIEQTAFDTHKDFTQLLTDAAMKPESSHASVSTQKFAISLSRDWISDAYGDVIAKNRAKIPNEIEINLESFNGITTDGQNESALVNKFTQLVMKEKAEALAKAVLTGFDKFCLWGGIAVGALGIIMMPLGQIFLGILALIAGAGLVIRHFSRKKKVATTRDELEKKFENKKTSGIQIIRASLAEVVDFRTEFQQKDSESQRVIDFLEQISPEQYVRNLDSTRRVLLAE